MMMTTTNNPPQTILTVTEFESLTSNYYLSNSSGSSYYSAVTLQRLPWVIYNVEINLNAMLNGRLYQRYPPTNLQFNGVNGLTPQVEQETLLQCLTECVEYKLLTQQYVNLNNNYSGNISGQNNYNTRNSNAIGLRQDIQAKLSVLGLYANIIVGEKRPQSVVSSTYNAGGYLSIQQLQELGNYLEGTALQFSQPITFNGGINTSNTINCNNLNAVSVNATSINTNKLSLTEGNNLTLQGINLSSIYNNVQYNFPTSFLNLVPPWELSLPDWSFFSDAIASQTGATTTLNILGAYSIPQATMSVSNPTGTVSILVIKCHWQNVTSTLSSDLSSQNWFDSSTEEIDVNKMLNFFYPNQITISGTITSKQLQNAGIPSSALENVLDYDNLQLVVDKVDAKINQIQFNNNTGTDTVTIIDPVCQGLLQVQGNVEYVGENGNLSYSISSNNFHFATGSIPGNPNSNGIINVLMDVYFTILIQL